MRRCSPLVMAMAAVSCLGLSACAPRAMRPDAVGWRLEPARPVGVLSGVRQPSPGIVPAHLQPLDGHIPLLWVNGATDLTVVAPDSRDVYIRWAVPFSAGQLVYLRIAASPFATGSCPAAGTPRDVGNALLEATDRFSHPLRTEYVTAEAGSHGGTEWNLAAPPLAPGRFYFVQACVMGSDGRYTGAATNTVSVELVAGLPDLLVGHAGVLRTTDPGKVYFIVSDRIARSPRVVRGESLDYEVSTPSGSIPPFSGRAPLAPSGLSWIISDFRIPDDGAFHDVIVRINVARIVPETDYANNETTYRFRLRAIPAVVVLDRLMVRENCDGISPGDWRIAVRIAPEGTLPSCRILADDVIDVDDNAVYPLGIGFQLVDVPLATGVFVEVHAWDCDRWLAGCGEEAFEVGGWDDYAGMVSVGFTGGDRASGVARMGTSRNGSCGPEAFSASLRYLNRAAADASGIRIVGSFDVSGGACRMVPPASP